MKKLQCFLKKQLDTRGITLHRFSKMTGIPVRTLGTYYGNRRTYLNFDHLTRMCESLNCQPGDLFNIAEGIEP